MGRQGIQNLQQALLNYGNYLDSQQQRQMQMELSKKQMGLQERQQGLAERMQEEGLKSRQRTEALQGFEGALGLRKEAEGQKYDPAAAAIETYRASAGKGGAIRGTPIAPAIEKMAKERYPELAQPGNMDKFIADPEWRPDTQSEILRARNTKHISPEESKKRKAIFNTLVSGGNPAVAAIEAYRSMKK